MCTQRSEDATPFLCLKQEKISRHPALTVISADSSAPSIEVQIQQRELWHQRSLKTPVAQQAEHFLLRFNKLDREQARYRLEEHARVFSG